MLGFLGLAIAMVLLWQHRELNPVRSDLNVTNDESSLVFSAPPALTLASNSPVSEGSPPDMPTPRGQTPTEEVVGIGAALAMAKEPVAGTLRIQAVVQGSPAEKAGLTQGLVIESIDGTKTLGLRLQECVELIRGPVGSVVQLKIVDPVGDETNTVEIIREKIRVQFEAAP